MDNDLLAKWLAHYDPIHRGWTPGGIANGVCTTVGFFFPRIAGGYNLRRAVGEMPDASALIAETDGAAATTISTFPWVGHDAGTSYVYRLTPVGGGGVENLTDEVLAMTGFDAAGNWVGARPNAPADLRAAPAAGGRFVLRWTYSSQGQQAEPAAFRIYNDGGSGSVDYETVVGTVSYQGERFHYTYTSEPFANDAPVLWAVRAVSAAGAEEDNEHVVFGRADALAPPINPTVVITCA